MLKVELGFHHGWGYCNIVFKMHKPTSTLDGSKAESLVVIAVQILWHVDIYCKKEGKTIFS